MKKLFVITLLMLVGAVSLGAAERQTREEYVEKYKAIAIAHMERYGIPASITMAQGILESDSGTVISRVPRITTSVSSVRSRGRARGSITTTMPRASASVHTHRLRRRIRTTPISSISRLATTRCLPIRPTTIAVGRED